MSARVGVITFPGSLDDVDAARAARLIAKAKRPLLLTGGGIHLSEAWEALTRFAEAQSRVGQKRNQGGLRRVELVAQCGDLAVAEISALRMGAPWGSDTRSRIGDEETIGDSIGQDSPEHQDGHLN